MLSVDGARAFETIGLKKPVNKALNRIVALSGHSRLALSRSSD